ncbi:LuxR C-terminal-related transcriptional regulator [Marinobacter caseinilyticus]|uniref:LuxR C-terminal-related transcriptional regulator n=1 Tax=Marinobacter caseinilyticus TaxID=2692195 RepID=UPI0014090F90|nr:LuxR C-terminal-related transcriptional regulator [Marinobacter caseinilyticus]
MKPFDEGCAANDEYLSLAGGAQTGELIWDLLQHRIKTPASKFAGHLDRPRAEHKIATALRPGHILHLEAPAGYGKSVALRDAIKDTPPESVSWITLNAHDNDPSRLLALLMLALKRPELRHQSLSKPISGSLTDSLTLLLSGFRAADYPGEALTLILDGTDVLVTAPALAMLEQLLRELPSAIALVIVSRSPLPIETHVFSLAGRFQRLTTDTLALSRAETLTYFDECMASGHLTILAVEHLYTITEGWLTPLALYRQELIGSDDERLPIQETHSVQRFLQDTLFSRLTSGQQRCLCFMSEFEVISDDLFYQIADEACDRNFSPSVVFDNGLPLRAESGRGRWFRFNGLARDWLLNRGASGLQARASIASNWFELRGEYSEALRYALVSNDVDRALAIASDGSEALLVSQDTASLLKLRRNLPVSLIRKSPRLRIVYGWVHAVGGQFGEAHKLINELSEDDQYRLKGRLSALRAFILRGEGDIHKALEEADLAIEDPGLTTHARLIALLVRSSALCAAGNFSEARSANRDASRLARESGDSGCEMLAVYDHARIQLGKGYLKRAEQLLRHGLDAAMSDGDRPPRIGEGRLQLSLALVLWHQGRHEEADKLLVHCTRYAGQTRDLVFLMALALRALIAKAKGHSEEAFSWIGQAERMMQIWHVDDAVYVPVLEALKVTCWLSQDQHQSAEPALAKLKGYRNQEKVPELFPMLPGLLDTLQIRFDLAGGNLKAAALALAGLKHGVSQSVQPFGMSLYSDLLNAIACQQDGKPEKANGLLKKAIEKAAEEHYLSPFVELKRELAGTIELMLSRLPPSSFVESLRHVFPVNDAIQGGSLRAPEPLAEPISEREQGVLELIAMGLSNQDIADRLHISLHTVKTHARRLNAKLEVRSRTQAIVRARELGLL